MTKLLSIIAIGACLSISSLYANDATVINLAGKQRMLTQKMSKEALFVTKGIDADKNKEALSKTEGLFDKTLTGLINGDKDLDLPKNENKEIVTP
jgi:nitrate/nitrite-specific signal transduction histidine kinase